MLDIDQYENTAAWLEYCDGMSRFQAETEAARRQGYQRWEAVNEISKRNSGGQRDRGQAAGGDAAHDMPGMQPTSKEEARPMPERDVQAGRDRLALLALRV
ncbi:hypothetical protein PVV74_11695 [Roseovarius sp. SK2]|uniref:hypothetical protein n=1 Tax=Roseovarius TaxID=74030 RepID=UPI00237B2FBA|nr:hypothetical protein [Roseovarius sp. SK2]MDD9726120.1 hypothetical protein [Roseovarius sp. SK2]